VNDLRCPASLGQLNMHLDPDFRFLTYGDNGTRRGAGIALLEPGDLLLIYAGLRSTVVQKELVYALVGLFVVKEVVPQLKYLLSEGAKMRIPGGRRLA
jgi:hypothetical protein